MDLEKYRDMIYDAIVYHMEQDDIDNDELEGNADEATDDIIEILSHVNEDIKITNLYDEQKYEICMRLMDKCNLETLEQIESIYSSGTLNPKMVPYADITKKFSPLADKTKSKVKTKTFPMEIDMLSYYIKE